MKIVINGGYGGFGLSDKAILKLYERKCPVVEATDPKEYYGGAEDWEEDFKRDQDNEKSIFGIIVAFDGKIVRLDREEAHRGHPDLIAVVEELGKEASGKYAKLKIVEIPDDVEWEIDEYDGWESVHEKHRKWE